MLLPHLTTFTGQSSLEMSITTFHAVRKPNVCAVFKGQTPCFLYNELNAIFAKMLYVTSVEVLSHVCSM
jgi:hypothetical protein